MTHRDNDGAMRELAAHVSQQDVDELMESIQNRVSDPLEGLSLLAALSHTLMVVANLRMLEYVDPEGRGIRLTCPPEAEDIPPHRASPRGEDSYTNHPFRHRNVCQWCCGSSAFADTGLTAPRSSVDSPARPLPTRFLLPAVSTGSDNPVYFHRVHQMVDYRETEEDSRRYHRFSYEEKTHHSFIFRLQPCYSLTFLHHMILKSGTAHP